MKKAFSLAFLAGLCVFHSNLSAQDADSQSLPVFRSFLQGALKNETPSNEEVSEFYRRSLAFLKAHMQDFAENPHAYDEAMALYYNALAQVRSARRPDPDRFRPEINAFEAYDSKNSVQKHAILFVGSSSIRFWKTAAAFPDYLVVNRGFGGAVLSETNRFYDTTIKKYVPRAIVIYCGDNDIWEGGSPEEALKSLQNLIAKISSDFPKIPILYLSMKPTPLDHMAGPSVRADLARANQLIRKYASGHPNIIFVDVATPMYRNRLLRQDIFADDGIHLNEKGYAIWNPIVAKAIRATGLKPDLP